MTASFAHKTKERTDSIDPALIGQTLNLPKDVFALFARYTIRSGPLEGLAFGAGTKYSTERIQAVATPTVHKRAMPAWQVYDALASYRRPKANFRAQINVKNLTDKKYYLRGNANRWLVASPRTVSFQATYNF